MCNLLCTGFRVEGGSGTALVLVSQAETSRRRGIRSSSDGALKAEFYSHHVVVRRVDSLLIFGKRKKGKKESLWRGIEPRSPALSRFDRREYLPLYYQDRKSVV